MTDAAAPLCAALLGLLACAVAVHAGPGDRAAGADSPPYQSVTDVHQLMAWIIDPAADVIWDSAGTVITAQGSKELSPTTADGWDAVLRAAATLGEAGNLLMMPGRAAGEDWMAWSRQLTATGKLALQAAQARDADALFDAGGQIYQACRGCHAQYWVDGADR